ncbi:glutathione synthase [Rhizoctonia solani]|uniref:Glutathione synthetase n=1 Tax=Rhizoctonia solani TaxID=456999 RepID=A0A0K6G9Z6_9AGAM|nr:glutathione synthase [Rhizoctonia solani]
MGDNGGVSDVDAFTRELWKAWKSVRDLPNQQPLHLGLFRSDYMLHQSDGDDLDIKQVEFNTISSSFGPLSHQVSALHKYLAVSTGYFGISPHLEPSNFPENNTRNGLVEGLMAAHTAYTKPSARILFVVQPNERNMFDQRWLEYELLDKYGVHVIRHTLETLSTCATLENGSNLLVKPSGPSLQAYEISVVYFRATYTPSDFKSPTDWVTRTLLEQSRAIKCPSLPLQLAGGKMIQAVLAAPGVLERFIGRTDEEKQWIPQIRNSWMEMWPLASSSQTSTFISSLDTVSISDSTNPQPMAGRSGIERASELYSQLVLKPQREGGGNNVYHDSIPPFLKSLEANLDEARAWIAMRLIQPPKSGNENYLVSAGTAKAVKKDTVSELGVFGWSLFGGENDAVSENTIGWLVRTKGRESDEGGVAVGYSVIDSLTLV